MGHGPWKIYRSAYLYFKIIPLCNSNTSQNFNEHCWKENKDLWPYLPVALADSSNDGSAKQHRKWLVRGRCEGASLTVHVLGSQADVSSGALMCAAFVLPFNQLVCSVTFWSFCQSSLMTNWYYYYFFPFGLMPFLSADGRYWQGNNDVKYSNFNSCILHFLSFSCIMFSFF